MTPACYRSSGIQTSQATGQTKSHRGLEEGDDVQSLEVRFERENYAFGESFRLASCATLSQAQYIFRKVGKAGCLEHNCLWLMEPRRS